MNRFVLMLPVCLSCAASPASAILIQLADGKTRVGGFLKEQDDKRLIITTRKPDGQDETRTFLSGKYTVLHKVDEAYLKALSPDHPKGYYDCAQSLAPWAKEEDQEAAYFARRLYLIAAYLDWKQYGTKSEYAPKSLRGLSELAGTPDDEARKYRAMAFLLDPSARPELLKGDAVPAAPPRRPDKSQAGALKNFTRALQLYREGTLAEAAKAAKSDGVDKVFLMVPGSTMNRERFLKWCDDATCKRCRAMPLATVKRREGEIPCRTCGGLGYIGVVTNVCKTCKGTKIESCPECGGTHVLPREDHLSVVLRAELWALDPDGSGDEVAEEQTAHPNSWSAVLQSGRPRPVSPLKLDINLQTIIPEFDPRECCYRDGKWVKVK
jgi:hypothetical protein